MKIVLAFDSFKGCMAASDACKAAASGIHAVMPDAETLELPLSDGGEGLVKCVERMVPTHRVVLPVHGPLMEIVEASYAIAVDGTTAYMEMAEASGLTLVPESRRNPIEATTYGVGEMIADAAKRGCRTIVMGIGGSATCDGGKGMLDALYRLCPHPHCRIIVACDVTNPLYGPMGAAYVFGPQKGASAEQVYILDQRLRKFARETELAGLATPEMAMQPGTGAAGGLGYALMTYLNAQLHSGIDIILDICGFDGLIRDADLVITGEGCSDAQTLMGKVPYGVQKRCHRVGVPIWLLSGRIDDAGKILVQHFSWLKSINEKDRRPLNVLLQREVAMKNMENTVSESLRLSHLAGFPLIRRARREDIPRLQEIFARARSFMKEAGNPDQWNADYPSRELIEKDIESGDSYVVTLDNSTDKKTKLDFRPESQRGYGKIEATFVLRKGPDPTYDIIYNGKWQNEKPYAAIHRIASSGTLKGIFHLAMLFAMHRYDNIRIDTHRNNMPMRKAIIKEGFKYCGIIHCWSGDERLAYHYTSSPSDHTGTERGLRVTNDSTRPGIPR